MIRQLSVASVFLAMALISGCALGAATPQEAAEGFVEAVNARDRDALADLAPPIHQHDRDVYVDWVLRQAPSEQVRPEAITVAPQDMPGARNAQIEWGSETGFPADGALILLEQRTGWLDGGFNSTGWSAAPLSGELPAPAPDPDQTHFEPSPSSRVGRPSGP